MHFDWKSYFIFTSKEQKGILVLGCILSFSLLLHFILPSKPTIVQLKSESKPIVLFYFDPNRLDSNTGYRLGLSKKQMTTLYHYREKGGKFYKKEDLLKWYGLPESQAIQMMAWVRINDSILRNSTEAKQNWRKQKWVKQNQERIDINHTNAANWIRITGLPAYKVNRILRYQKWSGGFTSIHGLKKVYGLTAFDFDMIYPYIMYTPIASKKLRYQTMRYEDWISLGIFDEKMVWSILKLKKEREGGKLSWSELVVLFDLTEEEANTLKKRTNLSN
jgi:DNA uptake protein ComE-like DNA-binding protein